MATARNCRSARSNIGQPLSPYAVTKLADEIYASVYARSYGFKATGLRYFNVFGPTPGPQRRLCRGDPQMDCRDDGR